MDEIYKNLDLNDIEGEIWLPIEGYENYQVSSLGRIKSLKDNHNNPREKILSQVKDNNGYLLVNIYKEGKKKTCKVHRLVCQAFLENPNGYTCVNHKDECKTNNCVDNLEWCDVAYNNTYGSRISKAVASTDYKAIVEKRKIDYKAFQERRVANTDWKSVGRKNAEKLTNRQDLSKQVYQYSLDGILIAIWSSTQECQRNGYNQGNVTSCCNGKLKTYKGYIWSYTPIDSF